MKPEKEKSISQNREKKYRFSNKPEKLKKEAQKREKTYQPPERPTAAEKKSKKEPVKEKVIGPLGEVSDILFEGYGDIFEKMSSKEREEFIDGGKEIAEEVRKSLDKNKIQEGRILKAVRQWLRVLEDKNKAFVEQEAKKKTDRILEVLKNNIN